MTKFLQFISWLGSKGSEYVKWAWNNKGKIVDWLNIGQAFEWIYSKIKEALGY